MGSSRKPKIHEGIAPIPLDELTQDDLIQIVKQIRALQGRPNGGPFLWPRRHLIRVINMEYEEWSKKNSKSAKRSSRSPGS